MEDWYQKQSFFEQKRLDELKKWMSQEVIDIVNYQQNI
jgi:hypothetical protein